MKKQIKQPVNQKLAHDMSLILIEVELSFVIIEVANKRVQKRGIGSVLAFRV